MGKTNAIKEKQRNTAIHLLTHNYDLSGARHFGFSDPHARHEWGTSHNGNLSRVCLKVHCSTSMGIELATCEILVVS